MAEMCAGKNWRQALEAEISDAESAKSASNAFLALLNRPEARWQAAYGLGLCLPLMAEESMEAARVFMRRLMWSLNEESGNLGWGVPEAMGCILAASPRLAEEYARIFISYGYETGRDDNFLDHGPLRRGVYWGIGRLAEANSRHALPALPHLGRALVDPDPAICAYAAFALEKLALAAPPLADDAEKRLWEQAGEALRGEAEKRLAAGQGESPVERLDGGEIVEESLAAMLDKALKAVSARC